MKKNYLLLCSLSLMLSISSISQYFNEKIEINTSKNITTLGINDVEKTDIEKVVKDTIEMSETDKIIALKPTGYVNDFENIFTSDQKNDLEHLMKMYDDSTSIQFCLVTSANFDFNYSTELDEKWGVGQKGLNNGFIIILSKSQRFCDMRTGYGLEEYLPDGWLKSMQNEVFPLTLGKDLYYEGMKEVITKCQNKIGFDGYDFLVKQKELKKEHNKAQVKAFFSGLLKILILLSVLFAIGYLIYLQYKKRKAFLKLKSDIKLYINNIKNIKLSIGTLPDSFKDIDKLNILIIDLTKNDIPNKLVTIESLDYLKETYKQLSNYKTMINTTESCIKSLKNSKKDIEKYLKDNYPYCENYLKNELNSMLSEFSIDDNSNYTKERLNKLIGMQTSLDRKLQSFLNKTVKINAIINDTQNINKTVETVRNNDIEYINQKNILSSVKIGNRFNSLVKIDVNQNIKNFSQSLDNSFNSLKNGDYNSALTYYGDYVATLAVINSAFSSVKSLLHDYNNSLSYINNNGTTDLISKIDSKINKSGVSYSRKSTYESIKNEINNFKKNKEIDIIFAATILSKIINELEDLYKKIKKDIDDDNNKSSYTSSIYSGYSGSNSISSSSNSSFGGFGSGSFGGGRW